MEGLTDQVVLLKGSEEKVLHTGRGRFLSTTSRHCDLHSAQVLAFSDCLSRSQTQT